MTNDQNGPQAGAINTFTIDAPKLSSVSYAGFIGGAEVSPAFTTVALTGGLATVSLEMQPHEYLNVIGLTAGGTATPSHFDNQGWSGQAEPNPSQPSAMVAAVPQSAQHVLVAANHGASA